MPAAPVSATPAVSVIVPTYNDAATLPRTVATLLAQDHADFELVIVNDRGASPADFLDLSDPRLRLVEQPRNAGVAAARNRGMAETSGDILYFLDADDYAAPDLLAFAIARMADPEVAILAVGHHPVAAEAVAGNLALLEPRARRGAVRRLGPVPFYETFRVSSGSFLPSAAFFRRRALVAACGPAPWNETLRHAEDTLLFLQAGARGGVMQAEDRFVIYSQRPDSLSHDAARSWAGRVAAMDILIADLSGGHADPRLIRVARRMRQNAARRTARLTEDPARGRALLRDDLRAAFNWKSAVELLRRRIRP